MARIVWDPIGERFYETGVDRGVLYIPENGAYSTGVPWNGLASVSENPSGAEETAIYADNMKYLSLISAEELGLTLECYYYPDEWKQCDGSAEIVPGVSIGQQARKSFGLSYRTKIGNDTEKTDFGYKIHLVYGCTATPSERSYSSINDSPDVNTLSYEISTTPVNVEGFKPTALLTIDSTKIDAESLAKIEAIIYGSEDAEPRLPMPDEFKSIVQVAG